MAKKSGGGGVGLVLIGGAIALLASVPREVWIGLAVICAIAAVLYFFAKSSGGTSKSTPPPKSWAPPPPPASTWTPPAPSPSDRSRAPAPARGTGNVSEPVSVYNEPTSGSGRRVPAAAAGYGAASWIPPGQSVDFAGLSLPGGMLYVGTSLKTPGGRQDPSLLDPSKKVASRGDCSDRNLMGYWPSYSEISPEARRAYLRWLAGGRQDPQADIGYVFIFFYGLERRAIIDRSSQGDTAESATAELPGIASEVRRLLGIYGRNNSFKRYASEFLSMLEMAALSEKLYAKPVPEFPSSHELPLYIRLALGQCAVDKVPVPAALALAWVRMDPNIFLRTPATRCPDQFAGLFERKYAELIPGGLVLPKNKTKLRFVYRPASAGLHDYGEIKLSFADTPDVAVLTAPVKKLQEVAEAATTELDAFSRLLGRSPNAAKSLEGLLLLPPTLWPADSRQKLDALLARMVNGMAAMKLQDLASSLGDAQNLERNTVATLARALEAVHIGMEPDVLNGAKTPKADDTVVLFSVPEGEVVSRAGATYQAATLTVQLATAVALADGDMGAEELRQLRLQIEGWTHLTPAHQQRLRAHMRYLLDAPPSLTILKKKLEPLAAPAKEAIAKFMSVVAQADGQVSPAEIKMLEKVYKALGVDPQKVFSDVHAVAAAAAPGGKPVAAAPAVASTPVGKPAAGFQLDAARIAALQQDTDKVSALLSNIFTEEPVAPAVPAPEVASEPEEPAEAPFGLDGLDAAHTAFVHQLVSRAEWTRDELLDLASDLELMLDGAIERVNEASFDARDGPLTEGEDPVTINRDILEKVPA